MEEIYELTPVRRIHRVPLDGYGVLGRHALWCEWDHPDHSDDRSFEALIHNHVRGWKWADLIAAGDTCIDIGAHSGDTTIPMAICAHGAPDRRGVIVAVEPNSAVRPVLKINLAINEALADFRIVDSAITATPMDHVEIVDHGNNDCNGGIIHEAFSPGLLDHLRNVARSTIIARGEPLGDVCARVLSPEERSRLSFIKIDCEGYDKEIIRASAEFLDEHRPNLFIEWFDFIKEEDSADLFSVVDAAGYLAFDPVTREKARPNAKIGDLLLLHRSRL